MDRKLDYIDVYNRNHGMRSFFAVLRNLIKLCLLFSIVGGIWYYSLHPSRSAPPIIKDKDLAKLKTLYEGPVRWMDYKNGISYVDHQNLAAVIVVHEDWCRECKKYSQILSDPELETALKKVITIKVKQSDIREWEDSKGLMETLAVPRTYFISTNGEFLKNPNAPNRNYYFSWTADKEWLKRLIYKSVTL